MLFHLQYSLTYSPPPHHSEQIPLILDKIFLIYLQYHYVIKVNIINYKNIILGNISYKTYHTIKGLILLSKYLLQINKKTNKLIEKTKV